MHQDTAKAAQTHRPQHILVVDDNRDVLDVITEMLRQRGDRVSGAIGGESMRAILAAGDPVDAVILCEPVGAAAFRKLLAKSANQILGWAIMIGEIPGCETAILVAEHSLDCALWIYRAMSAGNLPHPIDETANW